MTPLAFNWTPLALPLLAGLCVIVVLFINAARDLEVGIKYTRMIYLLCVLWWMVCHLLEMMSSTLEWKLIFTRIGYFGFVFVPTLMFIYAVQYVASDRWLTRRVIVYLCIIPVLLIVLAFTNGWHGLMWKSVTLDTSVSPPVLEKDMAVGFVVFVVYALLVSVAAFGFLLHALTKFSKLHRRHIQALIFAVLWLNFTMAVNNIALVNGTEIPLEPYGLLITTLVMSRTITVVRGSDILPVAREIAIEQLPNPVLIVDTEGKLVAHNSASHAVLNFPDTTHPELLPLAICSPKLAEKVDFTAPETQTFELHITQGLEVDSLIYQGRTSPISDARAGIVSYVISLEDVTSLRMAELERQQRHQYLQALWSAIPDAMVVVDAKAVIQESNASARSLLGDIDDTLFSLVDWLPETQTMIQTWLSRVDDHALLPQIRLSLLTGVGEQAHVIVSGAKVIHDHVLQSAIFVFTDVTRLSETERELRNLNAVLEARVAERTSEVLDSNRKLQEQISKYQRASESLTQLNRELLSLQSAVAATGSSLDLAFVLETVTWEMVDLLDVTACRVYEWHRDRNEIVLVADSQATTLLDAIDQQVVSLSVCPVHKQTLEEQYAQQIEPGHASDHCSSCQLCDTTSRRTLLPMVFQGQAVGLVVLFAREDTPKLSERQISLGQLLANQAAVATDHAHLYSKAQYEITVREQAEQQLRVSLHEKDTLLQEIHHRVKNNLQVISSLLNLQSHTITDPGTVKALQESQNRLRSMALIHERLYQSDNLARIDFAEYLRSLASYLVRSYRSTSGPVAIGYAMDEVHLSIEKAVPCGLIVNELVSNALKYAFPDGRRGRIEMGLTRNEELVTLKISDDGIGLPDDLDVDQLDSLGLQLVHMLTEQLRGDLSITTNPGTVFEVAFQL